MTLAVTISVPFGTWHERDVTFAVSRVTLTARSTAASFDCVPRRMATSSATSTIPHAAHKLEPESRKPRPLGVTSLLRHVAQGFGANICYSACIILYCSLRHRLADTAGSGCRAGVFRVARDAVGPEGPAFENEQAAYTKFAMRPDALLSSAQQYFGGHWSGS